MGVYWRSAVSQVPHQAAGPPTRKRIQASSRRAKWSHGWMKAVNPSSYVSIGKPREYWHHPLSLLAQRQGIVGRKAIWAAEGDAPLMGTNQSQVRGWKWRRENGVGINLIEVIDPCRKLRAYGRGNKECPLFFPREPGGSEHPLSLYCGPHTVLVVSHL